MDLEMKRKYQILPVLYFIIILLITACHQKNKNGQENAKIHFDTIIYNFGKIKLYSRAQKVFVFTNSGNTPLVIRKVQSTCGCTVPKCTKNLIAPGKKGEITVTYDTSHPGVFHKTILVFFNGPASPVKLTIEGEVI